MGAPRDFLFMGVVPESFGRERVYDATGPDFRCCICEVAPVDEDGHACRPCAEAAPHGHCGSPICLECRAEDANEAKEKRKEGR